MGFGELTSSGADVVAELVNASPAVRSQGQATATYKNGRAILFGDRPVRV
ncbi:MAG: hypothetical protein R3C28_22930 [Pirellulaceae bacterium]